MSDKLVEIEDWGLGNQAPTKGQEQAENRGGCPSSPHRPSADSPSDSYSKCSPKNHRALHDGIYYYLTI
jgi:hypothetical protein